MLFFLRIAQKVRLTGNSYELSESQEILVLINHLKDGYFVKILKNFISIIWPM